MRFLFTVKYLFQSNFSPLNVLYYLKDLKDRTRATHVAFHPYFQPEVVTYWLTAALLLREGEGCQAIVRPLKRNDSWKKAEIPRSNSPRVESRILYSLFFPFFFFHRWRESMKFERGLPLLPSPSPSRNVGVYARKQITGRQAARIASTPSWTLLLFTGKPAFRGGNGALS